MDGAEFDRAVVKKKGKGTRFLIRKVPSRAKLLRRWARLFENAISPCALFDALSARIHEFEHRENLLLFSRDRIIYDTEIFQGEESVGELTLSFASLRDPALGLLGYFSGARLQGRLHRAHPPDGAEVGIRVGAFPALRAALSRPRVQPVPAQRLPLGRQVLLGPGGIRFLGQVGGRQEESGAEGAREGKGPSRPRGRDRTSESRLRFRPFQERTQDSRLPGRGRLLFVKADARFREEVSLPLGKAFLLCSAPWDGYKTIYTNTPRRTGFVTSTEYLSIEHGRATSRAPGGSACS